MIQTNTVRMFFFKKSTSFIYSERNSYQTIFIV